MTAKGSTKKHEIRGMVVRPIEQRRGASKWEFVNRETVEKGRATKKILQATAIHPMEPDQETNERRKPMISRGENIYRAVKRLQVGDMGAEEIPLVLAKGKAIF